MVEAEGADVIGGDVTVGERLGDLGDDTAFIWKTARKVSQSRSDSSKTDRDDAKRETRQRNDRTKNSHVA